MRFEKKNGFLLAESLLALLICMLSSFLLLMAVHTLTKCQRLGVEPMMQNEVAQKEDS